MNIPNYNQPNNNGVKFVPAKCTSCGAELSVDPTQEAAVCNYCGTPFIVSKAVQDYNVTYQTNIVNERKGVVQSILDYASEKEKREEQRLEQERIRNEERKSKRNKTILWVLGWIFIFPVPLTILMLRNKTLDTKVRYGVIAGGWILYLLIGLIGGRDNRDAGYTPSVNTPYTTEVYVQTTQQVAEETAAADVTSASVLETEETPESAIVERALPNEMGETAETTSEAAEVSESTEAEPSFEDIRNAVENGDYSLVTPEFKETMDQYEAFYDEYIAFMKKYTSGEGDMLSMLTDYTAMLERLDEWTTKMDAIDENSLSPADDAYYLIVTLRVEKKLLESL